MFYTEKPVTLEDSCLFCLTQIAEALQQLELNFWMNFLHGVTTVNFVPVLVIIRPFPASTTFLYFYEMVKMY